MGGGACNNEESLDLQCSSKLTKEVLESFKNKTCYLQNASHKRQAVVSSDLKTRKLRFCLNCLKMLRSSVLETTK